MLSRVIPEAQLVSTEHGLVPKGDGWFVLNARDTQWWERTGRGVLCEFEGAGFEGATDFMQLGINLTLLGPGEPMAMYHWEADQEDFLVLSGEAILVIEGRERRLRAWDFVHCPPGDEPYDRRRWNSAVSRARRRRAGSLQRSRLGRIHRGRGRAPPRRRRRARDDGVE